MSLAVDRVVTLPLLGGAPIRGIPCDEAGFVPVDEHCRVIGAPGLYAVGDCTDCAIKQGGLATQEADAAAAHIAAAAGALVPAEPFSPVLRGRLMTGGVDQFLSRSASGESRSDDVSLWWPPAKVSGRYIAPWLARWDKTLRVDKPAQASLEVEMPFPSGTPSAALAGFTPYSP
jgi:sulfide:quinone oxidoreductase